MDKQQDAESLLKSVGNDEAFNKTVISYIKEIKDSKNRAYLLGLLVGLVEKEKKK